MELELINSNPTEYTKVPKQKKTVEDIESGNKDMKFLEKHELALFLKTAQEHGLAMDYVVFSTLAYTGMRLGELLALQWKDINFKEHTIAITKTLYSPRNNERYYQLLPPENTRIHSDHQSRSKHHFTSKEAQSRAKRSQITDGRAISRSGVRICAAKWIP